MSVRVGKFPASVARALEEAEGSVDFRYTRPQTAWPRRSRIVLMETPPTPVLASLSLDREGVLTFTRTGSRAEGARVAHADIADIVQSKIWLVHLSWGPHAIAVRAQDGGGAS
jgi:hypothetical protein